MTLDYDIRTGRVPHLVFDKLNRFSMTRIYLQAANMLPFSGYIYHSNFLGERKAGTRRGK